MTNGNGWTAWAPTILQLLGMAAIAAFFVARMEGQVEQLGLRIGHLSKAISKLETNVTDELDDHEDRIRALEHRR